MLKIAIVGPESSGKTTLCEALAVHYDVPWVEEYARAYLTVRGGRYEEKDLPVIAQGQYDGAVRIELESPGSPLILHDTEMLTMMIWSEEKFSRVDRRIEELFARQHFDHWLLCRPDIPWEADPLRENPNDRFRLFAIYEAKLRSMRKPYTIIEGDHGTRMRKAIAVIDGMPGDGMLRDG